MKGALEMLRAQREAQATRASEKFSVPQARKEPTPASSQRTPAGSGLAGLVQAIVDGYEAGIRGEELVALARKHRASAGGKARALRLSPGRLTEIGRQGGKASGAARGG